MSIMIFNLILAVFGVAMMVMAIVDYCVLTEDGWGYYHRMKECAVGIFLIKFALALILEVPIMFWNFFYSFVELNSVISWLIIGIMILIIVVLVITGCVLKEDEGLFSFSALDSVMEVATLIMPVFVSIAMCIMIF